MIFGTYKLHKATKWYDANCFLMNNTLDCATNELCMQQDGAPSHIARNTIAYLRR